MTILSIVLDAVKECGDENKNSNPINADAKTALFGKNLDSMGILSLSDAGAYNCRV